MLVAADLVAAVLLAGAVAGFAVFPVAVFVAEGALGLLAATDLVAVVLFTVSVGFAEDAAVSLTSSVSGVVFFSVAMKICLSKTKISVFVLNIAKVN
ncbi:hypothetical protein [Sphingobacterium gobiense]|uniref:hypothetical protein n=1 Tax=Sphingobacterium gobiense TaxID=1382456 RepID=UPI0011B06AF8|nr:hypothetical protein [Sphingobacterium gobiense]